MPAKDLGQKHLCFKCGTKFYDLKKPAPICPKCGADQRESPALKAPTPAEKRSRAPARAAPAPAIDEIEADTELVDDEVEADEDVEEPADDEGAEG